MGNKINDPIARLMGLRYKSHPWHGLEAVSYTHLTLPTT